MSPSTGETGLTPYEGSLPPMPKIEFSEEQKEKAKTLKTPKARLGYFGKLINGLLNEMDPLPPRHPDRTQSVYEHDKNARLPVEGIRTAYSVLFGVPLESDSQPVNEQLDMIKAKEGEMMSTLGLVNMFEMTSSVMSEEETSPALESGNSFDNEFNTIFLGETFASDEIHQKERSLRDSSADIVLLYIGEEIAAALSKGEKLSTVLADILERSLYEAKDETDEFLNTQPFDSNEKFRIREAIEYKLGKLDPKFNDLDLNGKENAIMRELFSVRSALFSYVFEVREKIREVVLSVLQQKGLITEDEANRVGKEDFDSAEGLDIREALPNASEAQNPKIEAPEVKKKRFQFPNLRKLFNGQK